MPCGTAGVSPWGCGQRGEGKGSPGFSPVFPWSPPWPPLRLLQTLLQHPTSLVFAVLTLCCPPCSALIKGYCPRVSLLHSPRGCSHVLAGFDGSFLPTQMLAGTKKPHWSQQKTIGKAGNGSISVFAGCVNSTQCSGSCVCVVVFTHMPESHPSEGKCIETPGFARDSRNMPGHPWGCRNECCVC